MAMFDDPAPQCLPLAGCGWSASPWRWMAANPASRRLAWRGTVAHRGGPRAAALGLDLEQAHEAGARGAHDQRLEVTVVARRHVRIDLQREAEGVGDREHPLDLAFVVGGQASS